MKVYAGTSLNVLVKMGTTDHIAVKALSLLAMNNRQTF